MAREVYKILAQAAPNTNKFQAIYRVPDGVRHTIIDTVTVANAGILEDTFRLLVVKNGQAVRSLDQVIYYDLPISAPNTFIAQLSISLQRGDSIVVKSENQRLTFQLFGREILI